MCELPCTVIITVKKGNILYIVYIMHDVSHEILILDTTGCMLNGRPVARGECISTRASGTPVTTSPAGE